ncbi:hypothetical protein BGW37DRAFT_420218 [Umbelopsis sp. PMI_123]|jgi:hypothetical protein|nr:hypothetical protein BGW37DRAFT_420218 [Umbelopsis sp. PMI_123]
MSLYILIPLLLLFPHNTDAQNCLKLTDSKACPAFQDYYISLDSTGPSRLPQPQWLNGVHDINSFDNAIFTHLNSTSYSQSFWNDQLGCMPVNTNSTPYAQYSVSVACAQLILDPALSLPCNLQYNILPNPLCTASCQDYATSVAAIVNDTRICSKPSNFSTTGINSIQQMCSNNSALSGTTANGCIDASQNEVLNCGK